MSRVLVLGGGGFAGAAVVAAARLRGWDVAVSTRTGGPRANLPDDVTRFVGDDSDAATVHEWCETSDLVIDAAAPYGLALHEPGRSHAARIEAARRRMDGIIDAADAAKAALVHIGSFVTTTPPQDAADRALRSAHPYFAMKGAMAEACEAAARSGRRVAVAAPTALLGPGDLRADDQSVVGAVLSGKLTAAPPDVVNVIDARDMAEGALRLAERGWWGAAVQLSGHDIAVSDLTDEIARLGGVSAPIRTPKIMAALPLAAGALFAAETAAALVGAASAPALPSLLTLTSRPTPIGAMQQRLGLTPRPLEATLRDEITWRRMLAAAR